MISSHLTLPRILHSLFIYIYLQWQTYHKEAAPGTQPNEKLLKGWHDKESFKQNVTSDEAWVPVSALMLHV